MSAPLKTRLLGIMSRECALLDFQPSSYCEGQFRKIVSQGVTRMRINNAADQPGHVIRAEKNIRAMMKYFSDCARRAGTYPALSNTAFDAALKDCPAFWPYRS